MKDYILPEKEIIDKITLLHVEFGDTLENATKQGESTVQLIKDLSEFNKTSLEYEFGRVCGRDFLQTREERSKDIKYACNQLGINIS